MIKILLYNTALIILLGNTLYAAPKISSIPSFILSTPNSMLTNPNKPQGLFIGEKQRLATCGGVAWTKHDKSLLVLNLVSSSLQAYNFDKTQSTFNQYQIINNSVSLIHPDMLTSETQQCNVSNNKNNAVLNLPEMMAISKNGKFLAVTNGRNGTAVIYAIKQPNNIINPVPASIIQCQDATNLHGVQFSPDSRYLVITDVNAGKVRVYKLFTDNSHNLKATLVQLIANKFAPFKPKGVDFSPSGEYIAISFALNAGSSGNKIKNGFVDIYKFDHNKGLINFTQPVSRIHQTHPEDVKISPDGSYIAICDQHNNEIVVREFNALKGKIGNTIKVLKNPNSQLSFPHGISISGSGKYLAVSNYGDDKVTIYSIN